MTQQIRELFPEAAIGLFYVPHHKDEQGVYVDTKGCLYNYYKDIREDLRNAKILITFEESKNAFKSSNLSKLIKTNDV